MPSFTGMASITSHHACSPVCIELARVKSVDIITSNCVRCATTKCGICAEVTSCQTH
jgi:hypothetical protein